MTAPARWLAACHNCGLTTHHRVEGGRIVCQCRHTWGRRLIDTITRTAEKRKAS